MTALVNLNRSFYMSTTTVVQTGGSKQVLDYLSPKYKNIRYKLPINQTITIGAHDQANAPGIAHRIYGDKSYWWVVCMFNGIINPVTELEPGTVIMLPSLNDINALLSEEPSDNSGISTVVI